MVAGEVLAEPFGAGSLMKVVDLFQTCLGELLHERRGVDAVCDQVHTGQPPRDASKRRQVDRDLARARIQSGRPVAGAEPGPILAKLIGVLRRMPQGAGIDWRLDAVPGLRARIDADDLTEALGALLENAMQHTDERVAISTRREGPRIVIAIRDDGRGVPEADLQRLPRRGLSLDPDGQGQGIGLAMVADIVDAAQGELRLANARPGFLAELRFDALP